MRLKNFLKKFWFLGLIVVYFIYLKIDSFKNFPQKISSIDSKTIAMLIVLALMIFVVVFITKKIFPSKNLKTDKKISKSVSGENSNLKKHLSWMDSIGRDYYNPSTIWYRLKTASIFILGFVVFGIGAFFAFNFWGEMGAILIIVVGFGILGFWSIRRFLKRETDRRK